MSIGERLRAIRASLDLGQEAMADRVGLGAGSWKRLELEDRAPKGEVLTQLIEMGFSIDWLLTGRGAMRIDGSDKEWTSEDVAAWQGRLGLAGTEAALLLGVPYLTYREYLPGGRRRRGALPGWLPKLCTVIELVHRHAMGERTAQDPAAADALGEQLKALFGAGSAERQADKP